ncbi:hypothetical protein EVA_18378 [gut metagenome]|uniref:Uncharacterized protein n=1 Tax=gut metagenome TaxID=749906 RepID=J9G1R7_9ZZZZ
MPVKLMALYWVVLYLLIRILLRKHKKNAMMKSHLAPLVVLVVLANRPNVVQQLVSSTQLRVVN